MKFITPGTIGAVLSVAAILAGSFGKPALASFLQSPDTVAAVLQAAGAIGTLVSGALAGVKAEPKA